MNIHYIKAFISDYRHKLDGERSGYIPKEEVFRLLDAVYCMLSLEQGREKMTGTFTNGTDVDTTLCKSWKSKFKVCSMKEIGKE